MAIDFEKLKEIAKTRMEMEPSNELELIEWLKVWWSSTYNLPDNHPLFVNRTIEEHMIDFYIKKFQSNPDELNEDSKKSKDEYEEWLKKEMGEDYHNEDDFLVDPKMSEKEKLEILEKFPNIKEEF